MQIALIIALSLHVLSSVFWAGSSFTLARTGGVGGELLFRPQMGAAVIPVLTGGYLGHLVHEGTFGTAEQILAVGAVTALVTACVLRAIVGRALDSRPQRRVTRGTAPAPLPPVPPHRPPG